MKGKCYYTSSIRGNDKNDGLSPSKPWKTFNNPYKVWDAENNIFTSTVKIGDGVFLERGSVFNLNENGKYDKLMVIPGVIYGAYGNGTLCNMKFHPTSLAAKDGIGKLVNVMQSYFEQGGMELQLNIISGDTLRDAQAHPENYRDLVVRVAGFSAYFVEVFKDSQDDLIRRTEMAL